METKPSTAAHVEDLLRLETERLRLLAGSTYAYDQAFTADRGPIDPSFITAHALSDDQLEERILFWIAVAGKKADVQAEKLHGLMLAINAFEHGPFNAIKRSRRSRARFIDLVRRQRIGCFNSKGGAMWDVAHAGLDLRSVTPEDLEAIKGIGRKTSRCFIMHSRADSDYAGLDTHVLKWLRLQGYPAPVATPSSNAKYRELERAFVAEARKRQTPVALLDLAIWRIYAVHGLRTD